MYVELKSIEEEMEKMDTREKLPRSCGDLKQDHPEYSSGHYTIDPNMGSIKDALKSYCEFGQYSIRTCVKVCVVYS